MTYRSVQLQDIMATADTARLFRDWVDSSLKPLHVVRPQSLKASTSLMRYLICLWITDVNVWLNVRGVFGTYFTKFVQAMASMTHASTTDYYSILATGPSGTPCPSACHVNRTSVPDLPLVTFYQSEYHHPSGDSE